MKRSDLVDAVKSKRQYMHWLRQFIRNVKNDEYLAVRGIEDLRVEMYKWDRRRGIGLFVVYSKAEGKQLWDTPTCKWIWIRFGGHFAQSDMWHTVNNVVNNMTLPKHLQN
jgi:hypothetical protein